MTRKYFGTDGVRGRANVAPIEPQTVLRIAMAVGEHFRRGEHRHLAVIGKDTRLSGYMLEPALTSGFVAMGMDVVLVGPMPTPAVAMLTRSLRADVGVVISASHNPYEDNGIKLFGPDGYKLSDDDERAIEALVDDGTPTLASTAELGRARRLDDAPGRYIEFVKQSFPRGQTLDGLKIVVDCAHGAAYRIAPCVLRELGATVIPIGVDPDGKNINRDCGATHPAAMQQLVVAHGANLGIAVDGDADRLIIADETGRALDGDQVLALIAGSWQRSGQLRGGCVVGTVMSNLAFERYLDGIGVALVRTRVGDRYVLEHMRTHDCNLGGEPSGHIILKDYVTTGDALIAALQVLAEVVVQDRPVSEVCRLFEPVPQLMRNVRFSGGAPLEADAVRAVIRDAQAQLGHGGRLVIRPSGTEPVIRVMAEGDDAGLIGSLVDGIASEIERVAAG